MTIDKLDFTFYLALIAMTGVLIWGLKLIARALSAPAPTKAAAGGMIIKPLLNTVLSEPPSDDGALDDKGSFSRTAGAIGAIGMASVMIGIGYWLLYGLFFGKNLALLGDAKWYFLAGSALFFPYAFNQLGKIFK